MEKYITLTVVIAFQNSVAILISNGVIFASLFTPKTNQPQFEHCIIMANVSSAYVAKDISLFWKYGQLKLPNLASNYTHFYYLVASICTLDAIIQSIPSYQQKELASNLTPFMIYDVYKSWQNFLIQISNFASFSLINYTTDLLASIRTLYYNGQRIQSIRSKGHLFILITLGNTAS